MGVLISGLALHTNMIVNKCLYIIQVKCLPGYIKVKCVPGYPSKGSKGNLKILIFNEQDLNS